MVPHDITGLERVKQSPVLFVPPHGKQFKKHCYMELWSDHYSAVYQILIYPLWHLLHFKLQHKHNACYWIQTFPHIAMKCSQVINCLKFIRNVSDMLSVTIISNYSKKRVYKMLPVNSTLTRMKAWEDFIDNDHHYSYYFHKLHYTMKNFTCHPPSLKKIQAIQLIVTSNDKIHSDYSNWQDIKLRDVWRQTTYRMHLNPVINPEKLLMK
jgi:hypothetical protein